MKGEPVLRKTTESRAGIRLDQLLLCTLVAMVAGVQACNRAEPAATPTTVASAVIATPKIAAVTTPAAAPEKKDESYFASGPIVVEHQVDVLAQREGMVVQILADVGATVHKGSLLAMLDDRELAAERDAADARLRSCEADLEDWQAETKVAELDFKRAEEMHAAGINTQEEVDHTRYKFVGSQYEVEKAQRNIDNARDNLRALEFELQKTRIEAPFDGVVARRYVRAGQKVAAGDRLFWVSAEAPLLVNFTLPERLMTKVKKGETVYVSSAEAPETEHPAKLVQISPVVDPASDSIDVMAELEGKPADLRPGMTARVRLGAQTARPQ